MYQNSLDCEQPLNSTDEEKLPSLHQPDADAEMQAGDVWAQLLALCPQSHRELLRLKRQGYPLAEIAARTGLHESSIRRILYDLARRFASLQATH